MVGVGLVSGRMQAAAGSEPCERVLYKRMEANLLASWKSYASGSAGASVQRVPGAAIGVFPTPPERAVYNNTVLARDLDGSRSADAVSTIEQVYAAVEIERYAIWAHESEEASIAELERRGYHVDTSTRAMAMSLEAILVPRPQLELGPPAWHEYLELLTILGVPDGLLARVDASSFHVKVATMDGKSVATALAYDHLGDCGIYNVATVPHARRRGLGTALTALLVHEARDRGCTTASLQATEMSERVYTALGFGDLGRFIEYVK
jgi:ribosomal protein S18 acetylase RimI-like enzyme